MNDTAIMSLAVSMLSEHEELAHWNVRLSSRMTRTAGMCDYNNRTISLSTAILPMWSEADIEDTILHEIAHALTPGAGHGVQWKRMCRKIGAKPNRCYSGNLPTPKPKWKGTCPGGHETFRHRRGMFSCGKCSNDFNPKFMFEWVANV